MIGHEAIAAGVAEGVVADGEVGTTTRRASVSSSLAATGPGVLHNDETGGFGRIDADGSVDL